MLFLMAEWDRTSLGESISFFRSSFLQPLLKSCKVHLTLIGHISMAYENPCLSRIMISQEEMESSYNAKLQQSKSSLSWQYFPLESCFRLRDSVGNQCYHVPCNVIIKLEEFSSSAFYRRNFTTVCKCPHSHFQGMDSGMRFLGSFFIFLLLLLL